MLVQFIQENIVAGVGNVIKAHNSSALGVMMEVLHKSSVMMEEQCPR